MRMNVCIVVFVVMISPDTWEMDSVNSDMNEDLHTGTIYIPQSRQT